ncbi:uncharacterized protein [Procambarus clarkii]|uniref:uncharacterized protein isoform X1 n=1 Tax=Procambarus clarkii TaxID=6728 RepID=UPI0037435411
MAASPSPSGDQPHVLSNTSKEVYELVRDEDLPKILFLCTNPSKVAQLDDTNNQDKEPKVTTVIAFKRALEKKDVSELREQFKKYCMDLSIKFLLTIVKYISLMLDFTRRAQQLSEDEVSILQFVEILTMFGYPVPPDISMASETIINSNELPVNDVRDGTHRKKKYFVYSENKVIMQLCDKLQEEEVCLIYELLRREGKEDDFATVKEHLDLPVDSRELKTTPGLKDTAFYYFILTLIRHKNLNRLYTHALTNIFDSIKKMRGDSDPRIDDLLDQVNRYPLASKPPGLCIILNVEMDRDGAQHDQRNVKELFENVFKYDVVVETDPTRERVLRVIDELRESRNQFYDSLVVWVMSHGSKTYVNVIDGKIHRRGELIDPITKIDWLLMKPKLFFFQACAVRYKSIFDQALEDEYLTPSAGPSSLLAKDSSSSWENTYGPSEDVWNINPFADTLVSYATKWYEEAARGEKGSLYVDTLVDQLRLYGHKEPIESVLRRTQYNVNTVRLLANQCEMRQAPYFESSLQKVFIFPKEDID